jgi:hypothetical protein
MIGIVDTKGFRKAVLAQRDRLHDRDTGSAPRQVASAPEPSGAPEQIELMREMRDMLARIETHLKGPHEP